MLVKGATDIAPYRCYHTQFNLAFIWSGYIWWFILWFPGTGTRFVLSNNFRIYIEGIQWKWDGFQSSRKYGHQWWRYTIECCRHAVWFNTIKHTTLRWQWQNVNEILIPHQTRHTSFLRASYGVSIVRILETIERVITVPHCIWCSCDSCLEMKYDNSLTNHRSQGAWMNNCVKS